MDFFKVNYENDGMEISFFFFFLLHTHILLKLSEISMEFSMHNYK